MKNSIVLMMVVLGTAMFNQSCKDDDDYQMSNQDFVTQASSANMFEIAAGSLALSKSTNTEVQAFGSHMVTDHGQAATEMAALAARKSWTIPSAMSAKEQNNYNALAALSGAEFDKQFAMMMVTSHKETIELFDDADDDDGVPDADLRAFAGGKLPTLKHHLTEAESLRENVTGE